MKTGLTITDVAEALGISKTTVSRAISGKGRIGDETRQKVLDFIETNNPTIVYKEYEIAGRTGITGTITTLTPSYTSTTSNLIATLVK